MRITAELVFNTANQGRRSIRVPNPMPILNQTALNTVTSRFVAANPFHESVGALIDLHRAERVNVVETVLIP